LRTRYFRVNSRHGIACGCGIAWLLASAPTPAQELNGYLTLTSDYVFRGASQSNEDPTLQVGVDYLHADGLFAGIFAARTEFPDSVFGTNPGSVELDAYLGYSRAAGRNWSWDIAALHYDFPDSEGFDYSYEELAANLHFRDILRIGATLSDDAGASGASGWTAEIELRQSLGERFQLSGSLGNYEFSRANWNDYVYWDVGASAVSGRWTFDIRYYDTNTEQAGIADPLLTRSRVVGSISLAF
jgi:uncharacterized protein (TIGR02001 family)